MNTNSPIGPFRLQLFGSPVLRAPDESVLSGRTGQRHRLALLSLLALAGAPGISRERLMATLWPESAEERARNLLKVSVYVLRHALGEDAILTEGDRLRLNLERVQADVSDFETAFLRGDYQLAIAIQGAPFLDGFFVNDAPDFEQWVARERERLAASRAKALEALASAAEDRGDLLSAVEWWKARAAQDPMDSRVALRLMQALDTSGNEAGALRHATVHEELLRQELGIQASPEVLSFIQHLRFGKKSPGEARDAQRPVPSLEGVRRSTELPTLERKDGHPAEQKPRTGAPARWRRPLPLFASALALAAVFVTANMPRPASPVATPSIAVLPLKVLSTRGEDSLLADMMTEELISTLGRDPGRLRVMSSTSVFQFRQRQMDVRGIADSLDVAYVLEASMQKREQRIHLKVRLIDGHDGASRWDKTYERDYGDMFSLQEDIAQAVARELDVRLAKASGSRILPGPAASDSHAARRIAAFELYVAGNDRRLLRSEVAAQRSLELFKQAAVVDSTYAPAYAGVARMYQRVTDYQNLTRKDRLALAEQHARKAVLLDPDLAEAHGSLGLVLMSQLRFDAAERELVRAIALDPVSAPYREWLALLYTYTLRPVDALAEAERAVRNDPQSSTARGLLAQGFLQTGRCAEALEELKAVAHLRPPLLRAGIITAQCYAMQQRWQAAIDILRPDSASGGPLRLANLGFMLGRAGRTNEARQILGTLRGRAERGDAYFAAIVYAGLGEFDQAFAWLERAVEDQSLHYQVLWPAFEVLHRDPRFDALFKRLGVVRR